MFFRDTV